VEFGELARNAKIGRNEWFASMVKRLYALRRPIGSASFDEPNLVSSAGLVPAVELAEQAGLRRLADEQLS